MKYYSISCFLSLFLMGPTVALAQEPPKPPRLDRLATLATYLDTKVKPGHFNIGQWGSCDDPDSPGYVGCAGGYAVKLWQHEDELQLTGSMLRYVKRNGERSKCWDGYQAMQHYFLITEEDAQDIFTPRGYRYIENHTDPHYAAKKIRDLIKRELREHPEYAKKAAPKRPTRYPSRLARR